MTLQFLRQDMFVIPVSFNEEHKEHKNTLAQCKELLEYRNGQVAIHARHNKLVFTFRTTIKNGEGMLDKDATKHESCLKHSQK